MNSQTFDERIRCVDRITPLKLRDSESPLPRGYTIYGREGYFLLISADGSVNLYFDNYKHMIINKVVSLFMGQTEIGAISIENMEVVRK